MTWFRSDRNWTGHFRYQSDGGLEIPGVSLTEAGAYTCVAKNVLGGMNQSAILIVEGKIHVLSLSSENRKTTTIFYDIVITIIIIIIDCISCCNIKIKSGRLTIKLAQVHLLDISTLLSAKNELSSLIKA